MAGGFGTPSILGPVDTTENADTVDTGPDSGRATTPDAPPPAVPDRAKTPAADAAPGDGAAEGAPEGGEGGPVADTGRPDGPDGEADATDKADDVDEVDAAARPAAPSPPHGTPRTAAFFDLDKTIIAKSSALAFSRPFYQGGLINRRAVLKSAYAQFVFLVGGADHDQMEKMRQYLSALTRGWNVQQVREIVAETLHELIDPIIYEEAASLIEQHHAAGRDVVIVSSSGSEVVEPIGRLLGADHAIATRLKVEDGCYTGEIEYYAYAENKAAAIRELAAEQGYDLAESYAYSDSSTDLPLLEAVGHPSAVNPDRALRKEAAAREWPVLVFNRPVELRSRLPEFSAPSRSVLLAVAVGAAALTAGLLWYSARRRRPVA